MGAALHSMLMTCDDQVLMVNNAPRYSLQPSAPPCQLRHACVNAAEGRHVCHSRHIGSSSPT